MAPGKKDGSMKILLLSLVVVSTTVRAPAVDAPTLSGKWNVHASAGGNESDQACTFAQKANELSGECITNRGTVQIAGKVEGKSVTWTYKSEYNGGPLTVTFSGKAEGTSKITGTVNVEEAGIGGEFTAVPAK